PVEDQRKSHHHYRERHQRPDVGPEIRPAVALEQDAAHEAHEVSRGQDLADRLRPAGHAAEREHEAREQHRRQEVEERELHRLELVLRKRRKGDADREVGGDEEKGYDIQDGNAAHERHEEEIARREQDDARLDQPDEDVRHDLAGHHFQRLRGGSEQVLHRAALALARHGEAGHHYHGHGEDHPHQAGDDVVLG